jgi:thiamine biosynthesis lipoprotein
MTEPQQDTHFVQSDRSSIHGMKRFSHEAMATTFEVLIVHEDERYARQAALAAFNEVDRLEGELSRFIPNSDISRINNLPANQALRLGLNAFECLKLSSEIYAQTNGAFDVTIGSLLGYWHNEQGDERTVSQEKFNLAGQHTGTELFQLDEEEHTITLLDSPIPKYFGIDLGGIGKGYAVDRMAEILREWSIDIALISGGYSSVLALDTPSETKGWPITLSNPLDRKQILARPFLQNRALGSSGLQKGCHIIDPRTGNPVDNKIAAWSSAPDAATADALSTAFMIMEPEKIEEYCLNLPGTLAMLMLPEKNKKKYELSRFGLWPEDWMCIKL